MLVQDLQPQLVRPPVAVRRAAAGGVIERALCFGLVWHAPLTSHDQCDRSTVIGPAHCSAPPPRVRRSHRQRRLGDGSSRGSVSGRELEHWSWRTRCSWSFLRWRSSNGPRQSRSPTARRGEHSPALRRQGELGLQRCPHDRTIQRRIGQRSVEEQAVERRRALSRYTVGVSGAGASTLNARPISAGTIAMTGASQESARPCMERRRHGHDRPFGHVEGVPRCRRVRVSRSRPRS